VELLELPQELQQGTPGNLELPGTPQELRNSSGELQQELLLELLELLELRSELVNDLSKIIIISFKNVLIFM
jgi:hypothetical protein